MAETKIYTRKGDDGSTSLWYGGRVPKSDPRTEAYGSLDEANSALGLARAACDRDEVLTDLVRLQQELFVAGAELATAPEASERLQPGISLVTPDMIPWMEERIDSYMDRVNLPPKFVLPGGSELSARLDLARSLLRRAERRIVELQLRENGTGSAVEPYVNRASDLLFAMARFTDDPNPILFEGRTGGSS